MSDLHLQAGAASAALPSRSYHLAHEPHPENGTSLGFWLYLMSDCLIFAALFATYGVLGRSYAAGPTGAELFDLKLVAINTARFPALAEDYAGRFSVVSRSAYGFLLVLKN